jgi:hypothetical protein
VQVLLLLLSALQESQSTKNQLSVSIFVLTRTLIKTIVSRYHKKNFYFVQKSMRGIPRDTYKEKGNPARLPARLLDDEDSYSEKVFGEEKKIHTGLTRAAKTG